MAAQSTQAGPWQNSSVYELTAFSALTRSLYKQIPYSLLDKTGNAKILKTSKNSIRDIGVMHSTTLCSPKPTSFLVFWFSPCLNSTLNLAVSNSISTSGRSMLHIIWEVYDCSVQVAYAFISNSQRSAATGGFFFWQSNRGVRIASLVCQWVSLIIFWDH